MQVINQNTAILSLNQALVPSSSLVDGRTEQDWLSFFADFGSLINFYDSDNNINGNWAPFLLKDPAILLASISKINVAKIHSLYEQTCMKLEKTLTLNINPNDFSNSFNQLFEQIIRLYMWLERWTYFMQKSQQDYSLKRYVIHQIQTVYSELFWAILAMQEHLFITNSIPGIYSVNYYLFESYDELIWKQNKDKQPFWQTLQLNGPVSKNTTLDFFNALKKAGDKTFLFFNNIVQHSYTTFEEIKLKKSEFPDTVLVRTFVNLLTIYRDQLNELSQKHLDFYYNEILKQEIRPAIPDQVFITCNLGKKDTSYFLAQDTLFDAGLDANKKAIAFTTKKGSTLNPANIVTAFTLNISPISPTHAHPSSLYLQTISTPSIVQTDENGVIQSWPAFGDDTATVTTETSLGFAIASPLLLLRGGTRTVKLTFTSQEASSLSALDHADYFLSTTTKWLSIANISKSYTTLPNPFVPTTLTQATLEFTLDPTQPAIEAFLKNPDGYTSCWPLLKIEFSVFNAAIISPIISSITIDVTVTNVTNLQLYNDYGALSTKTPYPPFGPLPMVNNNFIIGSNEIFSKPLNALYIDLTWDKLPTNFQSYYQQYNNYLTPIIKTNANVATPVINNPAKLVPPPKDFFQKSWAIIKKIASKIGNGSKNVVIVLLKIIKGLVMLILGIFKVIGNILKKLIMGVLKVLQIIEKDIEGLAETPFNNFCFTVNFQILENSSWNSLTMLKQESIVVSTTNTISTTPYSIGIICQPKVSPITNLLFSTDEYCNLTGNSYFASEALQPAIPATAPGSNIDPTIQITPLKYTDNSSSGFIKVVLTGPTTYGFGSGIYPNVVANIAMQNALVVAKKEDKSNLLPQANLPFAPKLTTLAAHYNASQQYDFTKTGTAPVQCFSYSPFTNYLIYNNTQQLPAYNYNIGDTNSVPTTTPIVQITSPKTSKGIELFPSLNQYTGILFLEIANLVIPNELNFYFELARKYSAIATATKPIDCYYLSTNGWQPLSITADGTNNLTCSGIITLNIPDDATKAGETMPRNNYWISFSIQDNPSQFARITFLKTNGIELVRSGNNYLSGTSSPQILSNTITKPVATIPAIATIMQPFPSFGGKPIENQVIKNYRISNRLKTKDRAVSSEDYFRLINQAFDFVYYSKTIYIKDTKTTQVYIAKAYQQATDATAFAPLISDCQEQKIQFYLQERASIFSTIKVSNFQFQPVTITVDAAILEGYETNGVQKNINNALNLFLSPWIISDNSQTHIDEPIYDYQIATVVSSIDGVASITSITFKTLTIDSIKGNPITIEGQQCIQPMTSAALMVSNMDHVINLNY